MVFHKSSDLIGTFLLQLHIYLSSFVPSHLCYFSIFFIPIYLFFPPSFSVILIFVPTFFSPSLPCWYSVFSPYTPPLSAFAETRQTSIILHIWMYLTPSPFLSSPSPAHSVALKYKYACNRHVRMVSLLSEISLDKVCSKIENEQNGECNSFVPLEK